MVTSTENETNEEMEQKITAQVEYYFDDLNLKQDKFMKYHMSQDDGWFPVEKLMTFNRLKKLTTDQEQVIKCIKSSTSGLVELNEEATKLRRTKAMPELSDEYFKELNLRTLHLKGFPKDSILDDIMAFCVKFGKVQSVQMRRNYKGKNEFKGCIMVTYVEKEDADKMLEQELKYNDTVLLKENKEQYHKRKNEFYESLKQKKAEKGNNVDVVKTKGAILKISGIDQETKFADIKEELSKHTKVAFVSNVNGQSECTVRFAEENGAKEALKKLKELAEDKSEEETGPVSVEFLGKKVDFSLASEEEEKKFWQDFQNKQFGGKKTQKWQ
ncbi:hypothetical protein TYRP_021656, partial [Tyrophagus putrescentiae]